MESLMEHSRSHEIWEKSKKLIPGGVNSPVRAYKSVGTQPIAVREGSGAYITDEDGNSYLDFVNSWGPLILGHADPDVVAAIVAQAARGTSYGAVTSLECQLAELIVSNIPFIDQIRFVNSGTEAVMSAIRLARGVTGRDKIVKFEGCYHGHHDSMLVKAGSGLLTFSGDIGESSSPGIPASFSNETIVLPLDDDVALEKIFENYGKQIAAVIIEPLPANSGLLKQRPEFIEKIRNITKQHGSLLILDEVITGFRLGFKGYAGTYKVDPDLVTYGKIIGGGLPVGAFAGKKEYMSQLSPEGKIYQAGTLSGNPLAMAAGLAALTKLNENVIYEKISDMGHVASEMFGEVVKPALNGKKFDINFVFEESIFWLNIVPPGHTTPVRKVTDIWSEAGNIYGSIFRYMLENGVHMAPSAYEVGFISAPMKVKDIETLIHTLKDAIDTI